MVLLEEISVFSLFDLFNNIFLPNQVFNSISYALLETDSQDPAIASQGAGRLYQEMCFLLKPMERAVELIRYDYP